MGQLPFLASSVVKIMDSISLSDMIDSHSTAIIICVASKNWLNSAELGFKDILK